MAIIFFLGGGDWNANGRAESLNSPRISTKKANGLEARTGIRWHTVKQWALRDRNGFKRAKTIRAREKRRLGDGFAEGADRARTILIDWRCSSCYYFFRPISTGGGGGGSCCFVVSVLIRNPTETYCPARHNCPLFPGRTRRTRSGRRSNDSRWNVRPISTRRLTFVRTVPVVVVAVVVGRGRRVESATRVGDVSRRNCSP